VIGRIVTRFAAGLRFPTLFGLVAALFVVDLFVPDLVPFLDEVLLALATLLLGSLRRRRGTTSVPEAARGVPHAGRPDAREQARVDATAGRRP
jgi:hypothetical protein